MISLKIALTGRRYSPEYLSYVLATGKSLSDVRLCKKSTVKLLRCSLNFLYRDSTCRDREKKKPKAIEELTRTVSYAPLSIFHD